MFGIRYNSDGKSSVLCSVPCLRVMRFFFETMMIFIANSETIHPNGEKSKVSPRRPPVGRRGTFRPPVGRRGYLCDLYVGQVLATPSDPKKKCRGFNQDTFFLDRRG
ncbi:hypothetical protein VPH35_064249 [Triticum aestivum]